MRRRLDEDRKLAEKLNESVGSNYDGGRFRCPINSGIALFEIMVHEGIHQGLKDRGCTISCTSRKRSSSRCQCRLTKMPTKSGRRHFTSLPLGQLRHR